MCVYFILAFVSISFYENKCNPSFSCRMRAGAFVQLSEESFFSKASNQLEWHNKSIITVITIIITITLPLRKMPTCR